MISSSQFQNGTALSNGGEKIKLEDATGSSVREFTYGDNAPWPTTPDGSGPSLILIDPSSNPYHSIAGNWRPSTTSGGNPGTSDAIPYPGGDLLDYAFTAPAVLVLASSLAPEYTYQLNIGADAVTVAVETSPNLIDWTPMDGSTVSTSHNGAGVLTVSHEFSPAPVGLRWFARTTVTER